MIELSQFKENRTETGAQLRGVRALIGIKPFYLATELKRPFVLVKVSVKIEFLLSNDRVKEALLLNAAAGATSVFGNAGRFLGAGEPENLSVTTPVEVIPPTSVKDGDDERKFTEAEIAFIHGDETQEQKPEVTKSAETVKAEKDEFIASWASQPEKERLDRIRELIAKKKFVPKEFNSKNERVATPEQMTPEQHAMYIWKLVELPDPKPEPPTAMPMED